MILLLPLLICLAETAVVTLDTVRTIFIARGMKLPAAALGLLEVTVWLFAISQVMQNLGNPACFIGYAVGFTVGTYLGIRIEERLALGTQVVRVLTRRDAAELVIFANGGSRRHQRPGPGGDGRRSRLVHHRGAQAAAAGGRDDRALRPGDVLRDRGRADGAWRLPALGGAAGRGGAREFGDQTAEGRRQGHKTSGLSRAAQRGGNLGKIGNCPSPSLPFRGVFVQSPAAPRPRENPFLLLSDTPTVTCLTARLF